MEEYKRLWTASLTGSKRYYLTGSREDTGEWFNEVCVQIITRKPRQDDNKYNRHINAAIKYITSNYTRDIGLSEIVEAISLHKVYLSRLFKHETGDNLVNYIMKVRIEGAKRQGH